MRNFELIQGRNYPAATHTYCGDAHPIDYFSESTKVGVRFKTDESIEKAGFKLIAKELLGN